MNLTNPRRSCTRRLSVVLLFPVALGLASASLAGDGESRVPSKPAGQSLRAAAAHVVISYDQAPRKFPGVKRSKDEARKRAAEALARARDPNVKFEDVVKEFTDDKGSLLVDGKIGTMDRTQMRREFQALGDALFGMEVGQVSDVVESPWGFHIVLRLPIVEYSTEHILVQHKDSKRSSSERSSEDARQRAEDVALKARAPGADFAALAREFSDSPSAPRGGELEIFWKGKMVPEFEAAVAALKIGEVSGVVATPLGFYVILRKRIESVGVSHIVIHFEGSPLAKPSITRTKEEARALAERIAADAKKPGADFALLAKEHSDGPSGPQGGRLGVFEKGRVTPPLEKAAFALEVGEVSGVVETGFGFHVILRTE